MDNISELPHTQRKTLVVHENLFDRIKKASQPGEHRWQTVQRLIEAGLRQYEANNRVA